LVATTRITTTARKLSTTRQKISSMRARILMQIWSSLSTTLPTSSTKKTKSRPTNVFFEINECRRKRNSCGSSRVSSAKAKNSLWRGWKVTTMSASGKSGWSR